MSGDVTSYAYLFSAICFVLAIRGLSGPETARRGNLIGILGMAVALIATLFLPEVDDWLLVLVCLLGGGSVGAVIALRVQITDLPQLVAIFHSLVGLAAVLIAGAALSDPSLYGLPAGAALPVQTMVEMAFSSAIGAVTFTGSVVAFLKLHGLMTGTPITFPGQRAINALVAVVGILAGVAFCATGSEPMFWAMTFLFLAWGVMVVLPIGGADMPVVISVLNSLSGWASCGIGFTLNNPLMIVTGALVGASGAILSYIMCKGMNRDLVSVLLGGFGGDAPAGGGGGNEPAGTVKSGAAEDAAFMLKNAGSVIIIPGYGMAVAQAQHALREMVDLLKEEGIRVRYAIHPVAGRMPGHMNVLLAEANVPYDDVLEMDDINRDFSTTDIAFVIGANDTTNPSARTDTSSPIYGMPILDADKAGMVMFIKRSMAAGYAGVDNPLFYNDNTMMLFGDAKAMCEDIVKAL